MHSRRSILYFFGGKSASVKGSKPNLLQHFEVPYAAVLQWPSCLYYLLPSS